jgi:protein-tyrosine phosphatase
MITSPLQSWRIRFVHCSGGVGREGELLIAALAQLVGTVRVGRSRERETRRPRPPRTLWTRHDWSGGPQVCE